MSIPKGSTLLAPTLTRPEVGDYFLPSEGIRLNERVLPCPALSLLELQRFRLLAQHALEVRVSGQDWQAETKLSLSEQGVIADLGFRARTLAGIGITFNNLCMSPDQLAKITFNEATGCWVLPRPQSSAEGKALRPPRYAVLGCKALTSSRQAHRVTWAQLMPQGPDYELGDLVLDHQCLETFCVYPRHAEAVTSEENTRRWRAQHESRGGTLFHLAGDGSIV
ncbi:MAG TPA: hypothetical protein VGS28_03355 [Candidatus Saccharimonadales bacterium]|nr:hypothetical protein [Candidatus Saccharimonadales bacterium]